MLALRLSEWLGVLVTERKETGMKLFAWQPNGHGEQSWFVCAADENEARAAVGAEIARRTALPEGNNERLSRIDYAGWGTDYYTLTVADRGCVLCNDNS